MGGLGALVMAVFLFLSARWRTGIFACPFGMVGILAGIILITSSGFAMAVKEKSFYKDAVCNTKFHGLEGKSGADVAKTMNAEFINKLMCSETCPCEADHHDIIEDDIDEKTLATQFKRTWKEGAKSKDGLIAMKFGLEDDNVDKHKKEYGSFEDCYNDIIKKKSPPNDLFKAAATNYEK